jgi:predicted DCC family thiol-disulfide oxidoreductase YuxK
MTSNVFPLTLYYEAACPLCRSEMTNLILRNTQGLLRFVDVSDPAFDEAPPGTTRADLMALMHGQQADGTVLRGVDVFRLAYRAAGLGWVSTVLAWPLIAPAADRLYPWIAHHRHRFPRWLSYLLFETAARRAAERAATNRCTADSACRH